MKATVCGTPASRILPAMKSHPNRSLGAIGNRPAMMRIKYFEIGPDHFSWAGDRSTDGGKTSVKAAQRIERGGYALRARLARLLWSAKTASGGDFL
jgi:hypothetical protein